MSTLCNQKGCQGRVHQGGRFEPCLCWDQSECDKCKTTYYYCDKCDWEAEEL